MPKPAPEPDDLATFLRRQPAEALASILLELALTCDPVSERLVRMQLASRPDKLAAAFRKQLAGWKRGRRFLDRRAARELARTLDAWLEQVAHELQPLDPPAALALFEDCIQADTVLFERADDSDGAIGGVVREACRRWLRAAAHCEAPRSSWPERLIRLYDADEYGAREPLLRDCRPLLDDASLRDLADRFQAKLQAATDRPHDGPGLASDVFRLSGALSSLSAALRDPDIHVRGVLCYSPQPNELQREKFVRDYLDAGRPADALKWLDGDWGWHEPTRLGLLSTTLGLLGRSDESAALRQALFEHSLSTHDLQCWLELLPPAGRVPARERAHALALAHRDAVTAARLLLELDDPHGAEEALASAQAVIDGHDYLRLVPLAKVLREQGCARGETAVLRALMTDILDRANSTAYGHAAKYLKRLREIAADGKALDPLTPHADFEQHLQARHPRKASFWSEVARVAGPRSSDDLLER